ncbi:MAG: Diapolycopene oxygenase, partial [uncultured Acetobacteraceae bacterium]
DDEACRGGGRRARRAVRGGGRGGARAPRDPARQESLARRQGGAADPSGAGWIGRVPLRHGADHPHRAARAAPHLRRGRARPSAGPAADPLGPAVALLLRRRHPHRPPGGRRRDGRQHGAVRAGQGLRRGLPPL